MTPSNTYLGVLLAALLCCGTGQQATCMQQEKKYNAKASQQLLQAVQKNDFAGVEQALKDGANIEAQENDGATSLNTACGMDYQDIVKLLLDKGALVNVQDENGDTPLLWACCTNNTEIIKLLIEKGAQINGQNVRGITPLFLACRENNTEIVRLLIQNGALVNVQSENDNTPLIRACWKNNTEIIKLLLSKQAPITAIKNRWKQPIKTLLQAATYWANLQNNQQPTQKEIDRLTKNPQNFVPLLFRDDLITKIMGRLQFQPQRDAFITAFFAQLSGPDRQTYFVEDVLKTARGLRTWSMGNTWEIGLDQMDSEFIGLYQKKLDMQEKLKSRLKDSKLDDTRIGYSNWASNQ